MLEHLFAEQTGEDEAGQDEKDRKTKKRKAEPATAPSALQDPEDDDDVYYGGKGKKAKGGIGYAGNQREDVSYLHLLDRS